MSYSYISLCSIYTLSALMSFLCPLRYFSFTTYFLKDFFFTKTKHENKQFSFMFKKYIFSPFLGTVNYLIGELKFCEEIIISDAILRKGEPINDAFIVLYCKGC